MPSVRKRSTKHLKANPEPKAVREQLKAEAFRFVGKLDRSRPFTRRDLEAWSRQLLEELNLDESLLGFTMVMVGNAFWKDQFASVPFNRRILLLPHCLKHAEGCPAEYDDFGLDCKRCGACSIADYRTKAEELGYKVLVAEGTPIILKIIVSGRVDAILGVACLNVLEKAIDKVLLAGVPSYAVPLHSGDCKNTSLDEEWVHEVLDLYQEPPKSRTRTYVPLMRAANTIFDTDYAKLLPPSRAAAADTAGTSPFTVTEKVGLDWVKRGGKRFRPFITLAAYDALSQGTATRPNAPDDPILFPDGVRRIAMAMEVFHKASLVHDDIEDDDPYRYGSQTLHRRHGIPAAINIGDYLIGQGYRLIADCRRELGGAAVADISAKLAQAHVKLSEGQGAELAWRAAENKVLKPLDLMKIYALKTSPAFEAALYAGLRLAGEAEQYEEMVTTFSRHLGVGFQILNDLSDWSPDAHNKQIAGRDILEMRPTLLMALALEAAPPAQREELLRILHADKRDRACVDIVFGIYEELDVFEQARRLVHKNRDRAEAIADAVEPPELRELLYFVADSVLAEDGTEPPSAPLSLPILSSAAR